ncbi:MAG: hypothetical protein J3K34DRAFT_423454 [Monoraphidium minutum]|nr:MAG: hypothetical protein J3K34DRAFT_423454 [Monoraphidium minutum]
MLWVRWCMAGANVRCAFFSGARARLVPWARAARGSRKTNPVHRWRRPRLPHASSRRGALGGAAAPCPSGERAAGVGGAHAAHARLCWGCGGAKPNASGRGSGPRASPATEV